MTIKPNGKPQSSAPPTIDIAGDFDRIVNQLRDMLDNLQTRVLGLTNDLQTVAEISTQVANILELNKLLPELVEVIRAEFGLHHVNIYLANKDQTHLILTAASLHDYPDSLPIGHEVDLQNQRSATAYAAITGGAIVINNVAEDDSFQYNDLIPGTRAKLVVPMLFGDKVIGVLGFQRDEADSFTDSDVRVKTILAEQLAVAIQNASVFAEVQEVRAELLLSNKAIQASNSGISISDMTQKDQPLIFVNPAFTHITGYSPEEAMGQNCRFLQSDDRDQEALDIVRDTLKNGTTCTVELRNYRKDGSMFWNELSLSPLFDDNGKLTHFVGVQTDITDRKRSESREILAYTLGQELNTLQDPRELLQLAVDRLSDTLNYYHAHVYLYNEADDQLYVTAGLGEAGRAMIAGQHRISYQAPQSLVATAARKLDTVLVQDVRENPNHLPNPLIPKTLSEAAVPLYLGEQLLGVLDVQADRANAFDAEELRLLNIIANQLSIALSNARQFEETQLRMRDVQIANIAAQIISETEDINPMLTQILEVVTAALGNDNAVFSEYQVDTNTWQAIAGTGAGITPEFLLTVRDDYENYPHGVEAIEKGTIVTIDNTSEYEQFPAAYIEMMGLKSVVVMPVIGRRGKIGVAFFNYTEHYHRFTSEEVNLLDGIASQIATGIESKRLEMRTRQRAAELQLVTEVNTRISAILDPEELLQEVAQVAAEVFDLYHIHVWVADESGENLSVYAGNGRAPCMHVENRYTINIREESSLVTAAAINRQTYVANDAQNSPEYAPSGFLPDTRAQLTLPMIVGGKLIGIWDIHSDHLNAFDDEDVLVQSTLAGQVAIALENARSYQTTQKRAAELETVSAIVTEAANNLNIDSLLVDVCNLTKERFDLYHAHIYLVDEEQENLVLAAGAGEAGEFMKKRGHSIPLKREDSVVATAARTMKGLIVNDIFETPNHLPNPLLPETRAEMAIPIVYNNRALGVLDVQSEQVGRFSPEDVTIKTILAGQIAVSVQNARTFALSDKRASELETVSAIVTEAANNLDLDSLLVDVCNLTKEQFELYHAHIYLVDDNQENLLLSAGAGEAGEQMRSQGHSIPIDREDSMVATAARTMKGVLSNDITQAPNHLANPLLPDTRSEMSVPIVYNNQILGVLDVQSARVGRFSQEDVTIKTILAGQIAVSVQNARAFAVSDKRAAELEIVSQVAAAANTILELEDLLFTVSNLTRSAFDLYHAHIYLYDKAKNTLVLTAGAGEAGRIMVDDGHSIDFDHPHSLVANAARSQEGVVVNDVTANPDFLPNPLLPHTRAEMAIPMIYNQELVGVLDVQADYINRFTPEDVRIKTILSGQVAVAIENARNYEAEQAARLQNERRAQELELVADVSTSASSVLDPDELLGHVVTATAQAFDLYHIHIWVADESGEYLTVRGGGGRAACQHVVDEYTIAIDDENSLVTAAARDLRSYLANDAQADANFLPSGFLPDTRAQIAIPMMVGATLVGVLDIHADRVNAFTDEDVLIQSTLARQIAIALENARTYARSQSRASELETVSQIANEAANNLDLQSLLFDVCNLTKQEFGLYHAHIYLLDERDEVLYLAAGAGEVGARMRERGHQIKLSNQHSIVVQAAKTMEGVVSNDVASNPAFLPNPDLPETRSEMAIPLIYNRQVVGVLDVQSRQLGRFTQEDVVIKTILAGQISTALQNARAFEAAQKRAAELETVSQIATEAANTLNTDELLVNVCNLSKEQFDLYHVHIYLYDEEENIIRLAAGAGEPGRIMVERGHQIDGNHPHSLVANAVRTKAGVIVNNVYDNPDFLPNPLLPNTRSEMAIPMLYNNKVLGVLDVQANVTNRFTPEDVAIKTTLAGQIAVSIENAESYEAEQAARRENERRARELETVAQVSAAASTILDTNELLDTVVNLTKMAFDLYHAHIYLYDKDTNQLALAAGAGEAGRVMLERGHSIPLTHPTSIVANAGREQEGVVVNDVRLSETFLPNPLLPDTRAEMAVPLLLGNELIGVLDVQSDEPNRFDDNDVQIKSTLASQVAVAVENARAFQQSQAVAMREKEAAERIREVDRLKNEFLASMSHELRTPLNSIIGYSEVMLDGGDGDLPEEAMEDIEIIHTSGKHLLGIINDILDLAKIEADQMHLNRKPTDLVKLLGHVIKTNSVLIGDRPVDLRLDSELDELIIPIDELRIRQVVLNLFSNAVKFTEEGSVTIELSMLDDQTARVAVVDTGSGISEEGQRVVFERFRQVDGSSTRKAGGTGLGLNITRHLVHMHGGEIYVESEMGKGSTFWFSLPLIVDEEPETTN